MTEILFERLHPAMAWLAAVFVLVVIGDAIVRKESPYATIFTVAGWIIWGIFLVDFALRLSLAPAKGKFLRKNWWQLFFLLLPFLAMLRLLMALRVARAGRLLSAGVRATRSATSRLRNRLVTVGAVTTIIVLLSANVLYEFGGIRPYGLALHDAALAATAGTSISGNSGVKQLMDVLLSLYSVVVFAAAAGSFGVFFSERRDG